MTLWAAYSSKIGGDVSLWEGTVPPCLLGHAAKMVDACSLWVCGVCCANPGSAVVGHPYSVDLVWMVAIVRCSDVMVSKGL